MDPRFTVRDDYLLPLEDGQAVSRGWTQATAFRPVGVTWHWTATWDLGKCREVIGGPEPERKGEASAHYAIGRSFDEGVDRYVLLENRSWHAGKEQLLRWDGQALESPAFKGARTTVGIETVNIGYAREEAPAGPDWLPGATPDGQQQLLIQPWTEPQIEMMIAIGKEVVARWPHIRPGDHQGHQDLCPTYKQDVLCFPFARVLRGIYDDPGLPDRWTPYWTVAGRQKALRQLGFRLDDAELAESRWGTTSDQALRGCQQLAGLVVDGLWTCFVSRAIHGELMHRGIDPAAL